MTSDDLSCGSNLVHLPCSQTFFYGRSYSFERAWRNLLVCSTNELYLGEAGALVNCRRPLVGISQSLEAKPR